MPRIVSRDELMVHLDIGGRNPARISPEIIDTIIDGAEAFAEQYAGRVFAPADEDDSPVTRAFKVRGNRRIRIPDLRSHTAITLDGNALVEDQQFEFDTFGDEPYTSILLTEWTPYSSPFLSRTATLSITGLWGFNPTPAAVRDAIIQIAARRYRKRDAGYSDQVDTGTGAFDYRGSYPREAMDALSLYRMPHVAVV
jgi:hypothetical protein